MSVYKSGGSLYAGITVWIGEVGAQLWISEVYEFTELPREWDQVDFTSHDTFLPAHGFTRTAKPGLGVQSTLTFKGIWMFLDTHGLDLHDVLENAYKSRTAQRWEFRYDFAPHPPYQYIAYAGYAYVLSYVLSGDLGDKFVYTIRLLFEGEPQQVPAPSAINLEKKEDTKKDLCDEYL